MPTTSRVTKIGYAVAGLLAGGVLAATVSAQAATTTPTPITTATSSAATTDPRPGENGADGVPEAREHHGGGNLDKSGTVTAVTASTVTFKTATGTTTYTVNATSDIDKNGEAAVSALAAGDPVTFSVDPTTTLIDKLHTGNGAQNMPQAGTGTAAG